MSKNLVARCAASLTLQAIVHRHRQVTEAAAVHAANVVVPTHVGIKARCRASRVDLPNQALSSEVLEVAVHGAEPDPGQAAARLAKHLVGARVVHRPTDDLEHQLALTGLPKTHLMRIIPILSKRVNPQPYTSRMLVVMEDDLMFLSRIREAAKASEADVQVVRNEAALAEACRAGKALVLANLDSARLGAVAAVRALRADPTLAAVVVIGYLSHVAADRAREAREAGVTRVLARSAFVQELPALLAGATR